MSTDGGKVKQTRRRQRLSCIECTKRRQKCDRQMPCGLCTARGIANLCRWEPLVARPAPQRPPYAVSSASTNSYSESETIQALSARIAVLEQTLLHQNLKLAQTETNSNTVVPHRTMAAPEPPSAHPPAYERHTHPHAVADADQLSSEQRVVPQNATDGPHRLYDYNVQIAAVALAQLSLAPREEYVGGGTILCALHKMGRPETYKFPYSPSNLMTHSDGSGAHPFSGPMRAIVSKLPSRQRVAALVDAYFTERNWEFGLPEAWFRSSLQQMWQHLDMRCPGGVCLAPASCAPCKTEVNTHWMTLLFAVLTLAPRSVAGDPAVFLTHALTAKRLSEDILLAVPTYWMSEKAVHGGVMSCIGTALLAAHLADKGRVSEAWKLVGSGVRSAQAMGLHRDPGWRKWETMGKQESELRLLGWWLLWIADRLYSFILGRPMMAPKGTFDVTLLPSSVHGDGSPNPHASFQQAFIRLCEVLGDGTDRCLGIASPSYSTILDVDRCFKGWLSQLPAHLRWDNISSSSSPDSLAERHLTYQRHLLAAYYLGGLMNVHRLYLMQPPPIQQQPGTSGPPPNPSREACIALAISLVRILSSTQPPFPSSSASSGPSVFSTWRASPPATLFHYAYFTFDGAVALIGALAQTPPHPCADECLALVERALGMLEACLRAVDGAFDGEGELPRRAIAVLCALKRAGGWSESRSGQQAKEATAAPQVQHHDYSYNVDAGSTQRLEESNARGGSEPEHVEAVHLSTSMPPPYTPELSSDQPSSFSFDTPMPLLPNSSTSLLSCTTASQHPAPTHTSTSANTLLTGPPLTTPYEMLQDTLTGEFDAQWTRYAGMDDWAWSSPDGIFGSSTSSA